MAGKSGGYFMICLDFTCKPLSTDLMAIAMKTTYSQHKRRQNIQNECPSYFWSILFTLSFIFYHNLLNYVWYIYIYVLTPRRALLSLRQVESSNLRSTRSYRSYRSSVPRLGFPLSASSRNSWIEPQKKLRRVVAAICVTPKKSYLPPTGAFWGELLRSKLWAVTRIAKNCYTYYDVLCWPEIGHLYSIYL